MASMAGCERPSFAPPGGAKGEDTMQAVRKKAIKPPVSKRGRQGEDWELSANFHRTTCTTRSQPIPASNAIGTLARIGALREVKTMASRIQMGRTGRLSIKQ